MKEYESQPLYLQLSYEIENGILSGVFLPHDKIPSTNEYALLRNINPRTALQAINLLVEQGVLYKKRGLGMFVTDQALDIVQKKRMHLFEQMYIKAFVKEGIKLGFSKSQLINCLSTCYDQCSQ